MIINNDNDNDKHNNYQRRTPDGGGWINMKNKNDHCSKTNQKQNIKICVSKSPCGPRSLGSSLRAAARQGAKNKNPGRGEGGGGGGRAGRSTQKCHRSTRDEDHRCRGSY